MAHWKDLLLYDVGAKDPIKYPFVVIGNKVDDQWNRQVVAETANSWCKERNIPYFETSAVKNLSIHDAFVEIAKSAIRY